MNLIEWLNSDYVFKRGIINNKTGEIKTLIIKLKHFERLAELIAVNGGTTKVSQVGKPINGQGWYGRLGLTTPECLELINLNGIFTGLFLSVDDKSSEIVKRAALSLIQTEIERVKKSGFDVTRGTVNEESISSIQIYDESDMKKAVEGDKLLKDFVKG